MPGRLLIAAALLCAGCPEDPTPSGDPDRDAIVLIDQGAPDATPDSGMECAAGAVLCQGACVDPLTDPTYCGARDDCTGDAAGFTCAAGESCEAGACGVACDADRVACDGACVDPLTDDDFCGASDTCTGDDAGTVCAGEARCVDGACVCGDSQVLCDEQCVDPLTATDFCGADTACAGFTVCFPAQRCDAGVCVCPGSQEVCAEDCVDTQTSTLHCGQCGRQCEADAFCTGGECQAVVFNGALSATRARWNYNNEFGREGALAACAERWPGSTLCRDAHLVALSGSFADATDVDGLAITSFWSERPPRAQLPPLPDGVDEWNVDCDDWNHQTGDLGPGGAWRPLDGGDIGELMIGECGGSRSVGCCTLPD